MRAHELAEMAALAAVHGEQLINSAANTIDGSLSAYWKASRCRLDRWCRSLGLLAKHNQRSEWTPNERQTVEEILVSEILSRVVAAIAVAHDVHHMANESAPVARNIFTAHVDVKRRAIALAIAPHRNADLADDLLSLRRQCERWTDLLLAYLTPHVVVDEFAASAARVGDFAYDVRDHLRSGTSSDMAVTMVVAGMRSTLTPLAGDRSPNADLNREIAAAVLAGFAPDFFDSHGHLRSTWLERIQNVPDESPADLGEWWQSSPGDASDSRPVRWRR